MTFVFLTACGETDDKIELNISAASSLREAIPEIMEAYNLEHPEVSFIGTYDSSGTLQTQIEAGAPCDVFISASTKQMNALNDGGFVMESTITNLLKGKLVLIVPAESSLGLENFEDVTSDSVKLIAVGDVDSTPVGQYTQKVLENIEIWEQIKEKTNYGTNVANVLAWVESGDVDCGFVYATDAATSDKVIVINQAPEGSADEIIYPAAVVESSEKEEAAKEFLEFLSGDTARSIFEKYGFDMFIE